MAQESLGMRSIREVLRLKLILKRTDTEVAASVRCAKQAGLQWWEEIEKLGDP